MNVFRFKDPGSVISDMFDAGVPDARLERLARLTAAKYWKRPDDERWGERATFMFRTAGRFLYAVFPIYRGRYFAVVRIRRDAIPPGEEAVHADDIEVMSISVFELDALKIAASDVAEES